MHIVDSVTARTVTNWFKFFQTERELWVQNTSATQLSMQFEVAPGHYTGVLVPIGPDPVCLTNEVPFESIKKSLDFRKFLNRVPAVLRLMTEEQAHEYYTARARNLGAYVTDPETGKPVPNVAAAIEHVERERKQATARPEGEESTVMGPDGQVRFMPPRSAQELMGAQMVPAGAAGPAGGGFTAQASGPPTGFSNLGSAPVMTEQLIHPRVLHLCQQVSAEVEANLRMPAEQLFREVRQLESALKRDDFEYIQSHGLYLTVKKWAKERLRAIEAEQPGGEE